MILIAVLLLVPADLHAQACGRVDGAAGNSQASDALAALQAATRVPGRCRLCLCDVDGSEQTTATDALLILNRSVGLEVELACKPCGCAVPERLAVGVHPRVVRVADVDGDGIPDLVSADDESPRVSVRIGLGGGRYVDAVGLATGGSPLSVTVADVVGDASVDLIVANNLPSSIAILAGHGDGTFDPPATLEAGNAPINVAVGDIDRNGRNDLVAANSLSNDVTTYLQATDGTFTRQADASVGTGPRWIELADLDGDGDLDAAVANRDSDDLSILAGDGDGTYASEQRIAACDAPHQAIPADLDDDGTLDLVVPCKFDNAVAVFRALGGLEFAEPVLYPAGPSTLSAAVADMDGDGNLDVVASNQVGHPDVTQLSVLIGDGEGVLTRIQGSFSERKPRGVAAADVTGDGIPDALTANAEADQLVLFPGRGDGRVARIERVRFGANLRDVVASDVDGDGILDLVTVNWNSAHGWFRGDGTGRFAGGGSLDLPRFPSRVATGDFNGDGRLDIVVKNNKVPAEEPGKRCTDPHLGLLLAGDDDEFAPEVRLPATNLTGHTDDDFAVADVDADGKTDIVLVERRSAVLSVLLGRDTGELEVRQRIIADETAALVTLADLNRDALPDVAYRTGAGSDVVAVNLKDPERPGRFLLPAVKTPLGATFDWLVIGDVDLDGGQDLVTGLDSAGTVSVRPIAADGSVGTARVTDIGFAFARRPELFDIDRDGALDIIGIPGERRGSTVAVSKGSEVVVLAGDGSGAFELTRGFSNASPDPFLRQGSVSAFVVDELDDDLGGDLLIGFRGSTQTYSNVLPGAGHCLRPPGT